MDDVNGKLEMFLDRHLPQCVEKVERVFGGLANYTFRLHLKTDLPSISSDSTSDRSLLTLVHRLKPKSLIAKIAYPYFAAFGKDAELPLFRQQVEERALQLFNNFSFEQTNIESKSLNFSSALQQNKNIQIPHVWMVDNVNNILILNDFGSLPTMQQWFLSQDKSALSYTTIAIAEAYGKELGNFVADMHICSLFHVEDLDILFFKGEVKNVKPEALSNWIAKIDAMFAFSDIDVLKSVINRLLEYDTSRAVTDGKVLTHGDLWPLNFLVNEHNGTIVILDWECAAVRAPAYEFARFLASCYTTMVTDDLNEPILSFLYAFMDAYREKAEKNEVNWYKDERGRYLFAWELGIVYGVTLLVRARTVNCCETQHEPCHHRRSLALTGAGYIRQCRIGPEKLVYDVISQNRYFTRLFRAPNRDDI